MEDEFVELGMKFEELAGGFVEIFVIEFGDTPLDLLRKYHEIVCSKDKLSS